MIGLSFSRKNYLFLKKIKKRFSDRCFYHDQISWTVFCWIYYWRFGELKKHDEGFAVLDDLLDSNQKAIDAFLEDEYMKFRYLLFVSNSFWYFKKTIRKKQNSKLCSNKHSNWLTIHREIKVASVRVLMSLKNFVRNVGKRKSILKFVFISLKSKLKENIVFVTVVNQICW